jgi:hypothetical protein
LEALEFAVLLGAEAVGPKIDLDLVQRAVEPERHLRVIFVDDRRSGIFADIETLVEREADGLGELDATSGDLVAVDTERSASPLADAAAIVGEVEDDRMLAGR